MRHIADSVIISKSKGRVQGENRPCKKLFVVFVWNVRDIFERNVIIVVVVQKIVV